MASVIKFVHSPSFGDVIKQIILNDFWRTRLSMIRLLSHPLIPLSFQQLVSLSQSSRGSPVELTDWRAGGGDGRGAKLYDGEKAWPSMNHLILSGIKLILVGALSIFSKKSRN